MKTYPPSRKYRKSRDSFAMRSWINRCKHDAMVSLEQQIKKQEMHATCRLIDHLHTSDPSDDYYINRAVEHAKVAEYYKALRRWACDWLYEK